MSKIESCTSIEWTRSSERLPLPSESPSWYFWGWNENDPEYQPVLLEAWEQNGVPMGFCHEAGGVVNGITHWMPALPPKLPQHSISKKINIDEFKKFVECLYVSARKYGFYSGRDLDGYKDLYENADQAKQNLINYIQERL